MDGFVDGGYEVGLLVEWVGMVWSLDLLAG